MDILVAVFAYVFRVGPCDVKSTVLSPSLPSSLSLFFLFLFILSDKGRLFGELIIINMEGEVFLLSWPFFIRSRFLAVCGIYICVHRFFDRSCENKNITFLRYLYLLLTWSNKKLPFSTLRCFSLSPLSSHCLFNFLFECTLINPT